MANEIKYLHKHPVIVTLMRTLVSEILTLIEKEDESSQKLIDNAKSMDAKTTTIHGVMVDIEENDDSVRLDGIKNEIMADDDARETLTRIIHNMTGKQLSKLPIEIIETLSSIRTNNTNILLESLIMSNTGIGLKMTAGLFALGYRYGKKNNGQRSKVSNV